MSQNSLFSDETLRAPITEEAWNALRARALECSLCALRKTANHVVFGSGCTQNPPIAFVGEGPGAHEDLKGIPFIGRAGDLLEKMLAAIGYSREQVYICNVVNCRPPGNRTPTPEEQFACSNWLTSQLRGIQPRVIVALGNTAAHALLGKHKPKAGVAELRRQWFTWEEGGIPLRVSYHPAYLLRNPAEKQSAWLDLQAVMAKLKEDGHA